ncbi:hypothetical protein L1987_48732 [Smallanthus sonchifolius]|uniref:Uncharacterized protein n=1 Tax=Smallanthus sonchifolius TaxID=185202 RepID=A0ACB9FST7_9ASTR|nr:hypothetical protein L1987_48732 [Smallanthus sonchifolius]
MTNQPFEASPEVKKPDVSLNLNTFLDSLLNFDGQIEDHPNSSLAEAMNSAEKPNLENLTAVENKQQKEEEVCSSEKLQGLGSFIQEEMGRVCLTSGTEVVDSLGSSEVKSLNENEVKTDTEKGEDTGDVNGGGDSEDSEEDESSSSSSSSSSDDDDEESDDEEEEYDEKGLKEVEMEDGEIREEVVAWSDDEDDYVVKDPIRSKNEVKDLPPVPAVTVTIQPHHQTLPVGVILSIMGAQVIVEGVEDHNPLNEGSILWITESRSPLGVVDEIFGPVKNPYYIIRYNSETEIPTGIQQGCLISFVPEFADHVLNSNNNLYKKGYDASGENDEELSDELEFSDDEKEAEYKKMLKMSKRGSNEQNMKKDKKSRNRGGNNKNNHQHLSNSQVNICSSSGGPQASNFTPAGVWPGGPPPIQPQAPNFTPSGVWPSGLPPIQQQNNGFPCNVPPFMQQSFIQQPVQNLGVPSLPPFNPQFNTNFGQMFPCNFVQGVPPNSGAFAFWPQNNFSQSHVWPPMGLPQGVAAIPNGIEMNNNNNNNSNGAGNGESCPNPNQGNRFPNHGGRRPFQRGGGGSFRGRRPKP